MLRMMNDTLMRIDEPHKEKIVKTLIPFVWFLILVFFSCKDVPVIDLDVTRTFSAQISNCVGPILWKADGIKADSVFVWTFGNKLIIDFSFHANCCIDSSDFLVSQSISNDTITITMTDTAFSVCRCICTYMAHVEFTGLPNNHYVIQCIAGNRFGYGPPEHLVHVMRPW